MMPLSPAALAGSSCSMAFARSFSVMKIPLLVGVCAVGNQRSAILSNAQGELIPLERNMHALAATEKGTMNGRSVEAFAARIGRHDQVWTDRFALRV